MVQLIDVVVPLPVYKVFTYVLPEGMPLPAIGSRVLVPVGHRDMVGMIWRSSAKRPSSIELKEVKRILDTAPLVPESLVRFIEWTSSYYFYPLGQVVAEALPPGLLSARNRRISQITGCPEKARRCRLNPVSWSFKTPLELTEEQKGALNLIYRAISDRSYHPMLLYGVTDSGKTEVYLQAAAECLRHGRDVLVLVPEIAMTLQAVAWFMDRFGGEVTVLHSGLTDVQRRYQWWKIRHGESRIVVGTRSAIFAPISDIGLIVIDEEHDPSYKQSERLRYQARDLALLRGRMSGASVVLGSATPSLSTYRNAMLGRYQLITMKRRVGKRPLPEVVIVDRKKEGRGSTGYEWLSERLEGAIRDTLARKEQVLLFLNRRGFATYVFCPECGHVFRCPHCEVALTWHRGETRGRPEGVLRCHYCGMELPALPLCPCCGGKAVRALGYGTERVASDLKDIFPEARIARLDRDTVQGRRHLEKIVLDFRERRLDILVGTQMITKGHHFPGLTLVGILWADLSLNLPEYHAAERTFQLFAQVAGRAGRGERPGQVLIQTWLPNHYVLHHARAYDFEGFYKKESEFRQALEYPPFGHLINLRFSGYKKALVCSVSGDAARLAKRLARGIKEEPQVEVLGPAPAPRLKLRDRYRWQVLLKSASLSGLRAVCSGLLSKKADIVPSSVRMEIDVDPFSML